MQGRRHPRGGEFSRLEPEPDEEIFTMDKFAHVTRIRSEPSGITCKATCAVGKKPIPAIKMLLGRESNFSGRGRFSSADRTHVLSQYLPVQGPWLVDQMNSQAFVSQFSEDGSLFFVGFRGSHIRIYNVDNGWKVQKDISVQSSWWTITDTSLSPDKRHLIYSSLSPIVHIVNVGNNITDRHEGLNFSVHSDGENFRIFSVKFSTDGQELVAGGSDKSIYVYDLEANKLKLRFPAHTADVNTVTFADETGQLIFSGSDDCLCKVWDRRCFNSTEKPAGTLTGHLEGITFIDSRGDGRYFISNGKDHATKLWDIRRMSSATTVPKVSDWDNQKYTCMPCPAEVRMSKHPCDQSLATYRGHSVSCTLIRCYFSPAYSTGQKYIYTGSYDHCVYIYDVVTGATVARLAGHASAIRDCSWHPYYPMLVSSSWDCSIARWEFFGDEPVLELFKRESTQILGCSKGKAEGGRH